MKESSSVGGKRGRSVVGGEDEIETTQKREREREREKGKREVKEDFCLLIIFVFIFLKIINFILQTWIGQSCPLKWKGKDFLAS